MALQLNECNRLQLVHDVVNLDRLQADNNYCLIRYIQNRRQAQQRKSRRRMQTRMWLIRRPIYGIYEQLMGELEQGDFGGFTNFIRMHPGRFHELLDRVDDRIKKMDTWYRKAIDPGLKLAITLRYYASGDSYHSLMYSFRVAHNTISLIVAEVSQAIIDEFAAYCPSLREQMAVPSHTRSNRWETCGNSMSHQWWIPLLQL
jgi:hypothetical protein